MIKLTAGAFAFALCVIPFLEGMNKEHLAQQSGRPLGTPCGEKILTMTSEGAKIWNRETGELLHFIRTSTCPLSSVSFSMNGSSILIVGPSGTAQRRDVSSGAVLASYPGHIRSAQFNPDSSMVLTLDRDGKAQLWHAENGVLAASFQGPFLSAQFSPDSQILLIDEQGATLWDVKNQKHVRIGFTRSLESATFNEDGSVTVTRGQEPAT